MQIFYNFLWSTPANGWFASFSPVFLAGDVNGEQVFFDARHHEELLQHAVHVTSRPAVLQANEARGGPILHGRR